MKRLLFALFLASSVVAVAQAPAASPQTKAEKKAAKKAATAAKAAAVPAPVARPVPVTKPAATKAIPVSTAIIANKATKTYHRANCTYVAKMNEANRVGFANAAEAAKAGYKPCKVCKPE